MNFLLEIYKPEFCKITPLLYRYMKHKRNLILLSVLRIYKCILNGAGISGFTFTRILAYRKFKITGREF